MPSLDSALSPHEVPHTAPSKTAPGSRGKATGRRYSRWHLETNLPPEEDGWLLTYLDVITLMLVMMVVMLSVAGPPSETGGKGVPNATTPPPDPLATAPAATIQPPTVVPPLPVSNPAADSNTEQAALSSDETPNESAPTTQTPEPPKPDTWAGLKLDQIGQDIEVTPGKASVRFRISNELLFGSGDAKLISGGNQVLDKLLPTLLSDPDMLLVVEGHTDNIPIQTARFPSNWELSTGRAASVARYLIERGIAPQRIQASGYADTRPVGSKNNPVDRNINRRVELILVKDPAAN